MQAKLRLSRGRAAAQWAATAAESYAQMRRRVIAQLVAQIPAAQRVSVGVGPANLHFYWWEPDDKRDADNVAAGKKFVLDALVVAKLLPNDTRRCVLGFRDEVRVAPVGGAVGVVVEIWMGGRLLPGELFFSGQLPGANEIRQAIEIGVRRSLRKGGE